ncbi:MAG TPA: hypothetical protein VK909_17945, partial [Anaerolineales bacterium]|nr:hypothetical protein [Anaerolineales bacterium]
MPASFIQQFMTNFRHALQSRQDRIAALLVPLPLLGYWIFWTLHPSYWFNADPAALYLVDSLSAFIGKTYVYVDHPGTPVQVIGSLLLALAYPFFQSKEVFIQFFLIRPNVFFFMANVFLLAANLFTAVAFYRTVVKNLTHNRILAALALSLLFFTLHPHSYPSLTFWSHNSLNFPFGTLLLLWLYRELCGGELIRPGRLILLGIASGILSVAQMYFVAWLVSLIFTIVVYSLRTGRGGKQATISGLYVTTGGMIGILLMLLPIYKEIPRFMAWLMGIISHLGLYGSGESGVYSLTLLSASIGYWWTTIRPMILLLVVTVILLGLIVYWSRRTTVTIPAADFAMVLGLLFHTGLILLMMTKAALKLRYSLSLAATLPVLVFLVLKLLESTPWRIHRFLPFFYGALLVGTVTSMVAQMQLADQRAYQEQDAQVAKVQAINRLAKEKKVKESGIVVVYAYAVPLKCAGMLQATNWIGNFQKEMNEICPNQYAIWESSIKLNTAVPVRDIDDIDWDIVIWPGNGTDLPNYLYAKGA